MDELQSAIKRAQLCRDFQVSERATSPLVSPAIRQEIAAVDPRPQPAKFPKIVDIKKAVCDYYSVLMADMDSARRDLGITYPRHMAIYLARVLTPHSSAEIGRRFGGRDHTTVLSSVRKVEWRMGGRGPTADRLLCEFEELKRIIMARFNGEAKQA